MQLQCTADTSRRWYEVKIKYTLWHNTWHSFASISILLLHGKWVAHTNISYMYINTYIICYAV